MKRLIGVQILFGRVAPNAVDMRNKQSESRLTVGRWTGEDVHGCVALSFWAVSR